MRNLTTTPPSGSKLIIPAALAQAALPGRPPRRSAPIRLGTSGLFIFSAHSHACYVPPRQGGIACMPQPTCRARRGAGGQGPAPPPLTLPPTGWPMLCDLLS